MKTIASKGYKINAANLKEVVEGLNNIECLLMGIEDIADRGSLGEVEQEIVRAAVHRGLQMKDKVTLALPGKGDSP